MVNKDIDINLNDMDKVVSALKSAATTLGTMTKDIDKKTSELLSSWNGKSKNAFEVEYNVLKVHLGGYEEVLNSMAGILKSTKDNFQDADKKLSNSMNDEVASGSESGGGGSNSW